jgi:hypothetical protein
MKKKLPRTPDDIALRRQNYIDAIGRESDRGCVLVAGSVLDEGLEQLLRAEMPEDPKLLGELFNNSGPLASFWARSRAALALGYITKDTFEDLEIIREVRNRFAHGYGPATLTDPRPRKPSLSSNPLTRDLRLPDARTTRRSCLRRHPRQSQIRQS